MINKYTLICLFVWVSFSVSAQDIIASFIDKHGGDDNLEVVSIGKKMMDTLCILTSDDPDLKEAIKGLESIRIVSSKDSDVEKEYFSSAQELLSKYKGLEEYFSTSEENRELMVMVRKSKESVKELILLSEQPEGFNLISISGTINLDVLLNYSERLNIKELDQLRSVKNNHNQ